MQVMFVQDPAYVVAPAEIITHECSGWVIPERESPIHPDLLDGFYRLIRKIDAQICHADCICRRSATGFFARIAEAGIIQQMRAENMALMQQDVLRRDCRTILVGQEIGGIKYRIAGKAIICVSHREAVGRGKNMFQFAQNIMKVALVRLSEGHISITTPNGYTLSRLMIAGSVASALW